MKNNATGDTATLGRQLRLKVHAHRWPLTLLALTWLIFFSRTLFLGELYFLDDLKIIFYPLEHVYAEFQRAWSLPQWSPLFGFGHPLLAWGQLGFFTPLHVVLRLLGLHPLMLLQVSIVSYFALGLGGMYWFLSRHKLHPLAAALGAITYTFCGFQVGHLNHVNFYVATMVLPLLLGLVDRFVEKPTATRTALMASIAASIPLSGHAQMALYTLLVAAIYGVSKVVGEYRQHEKMPAAEKANRWMVKMIALTLVAATVSVALASFSILPLLELLPYSDRAGSLTHEELFEFSYPLKHAITLIFPYYFGDHERYWGAKNFQELSAYVGVLPLLLAAFAAMSWKKHRLLLTFSALLVAVSLIVAPGIHSPLYRYLVEQGIVTSLAIPGRFVFFFDIGIALLAALGLQRYVTGNYRQATVIAPLLVVASAVTLIYYGWNYNPLTPADAALRTSPFTTTLIKHGKQTGVPARLLSREDLLRQEASAEQHATKALSEKVSLHQWTSIPENTTGCLVVPLYTQATADHVINVTLREQPGSQPLATGAISTSEIHNDQDYRLCFPKMASNKLLLSFSSPTKSDTNLYFKPVTTQAHERMYTTASADPTHLADPTRDAQLIFTWEIKPETDKEATLLSRHVQATAATSGVRWISAFSIRAYRDFVETFFANDTTPINGAGEHFVTANRDVIDASGVTHLIQLLPLESEDVMPQAGFEVVATERFGADEARLYTNPDAAARAFMTRTLWQDPRGLPPQLDANLRFTTYEPTKVTIDVATPEAGYLVLTDAWTPEWHALLNDQPISLQQAAGVFRSVEVPAGEHTVTFFYDSPAIQAAQILTLGALVVVIGLILFPHIYQSQALSNKKHE